MKTKYITPKSTIITLGAENHLLHKSLETDLPGTGSGGEGSGEIEADTKVEFNIIRNIWDEEW